MLGTGVGGACGYAIGANAVGRAAPVDEPLVPTGDADLDELRRLAVKAPIEELMEKAPTFVSLLDDTYPRDRILWQGMERICDALLAGHEVPNRRLFAKVVAQQIENSDPTLAAHLQTRASELRRIK
ncbi:MAG: hypothetical protein ABIP94_02795 [Planctomycetota bacterium]